MKKKINIPNAITALRIVGTGILIFLEPLTSWFYVIYTASGITDVLDGFIARKTNTTTELGARLDSIADLMYYATMILRIFPILWAQMPWQIWIVLAVIIVLRLIAYLVAAVKYHRFSAIHTWMNKVTGLMVFLIPYMIATSADVVYCSMACAVAVFSALEELALHLTAKQYDPKTKSIVERLLALRGKSETAPVK